MRKYFQVLIPTLLVCVATIGASAQSFRVQCPSSTITHPGDNNTEPAYNGPTNFTPNAQGYLTPTGNVNGAIKCQQVSGGDGFATMADGTQTFMFSFGPLSGLADIAAGLPGTQFPNVDSHGVTGNGFNAVYPGLCATCNSALQRGDPATTDGAGNVINATNTTGKYTQGNLATFNYNGAIGLSPEVVNLVTITGLVAGPIATPETSACATPDANTVTVYTDANLGLPAGSIVNINNVTTAGFNGTNLAITCVNPGLVLDPNGFNAYAFTVENSSAAGLGTLVQPTGGTVSAPPQVDGHVDPREIINVGVMNGNIPAPLVAFDEDDEMFLTLTNVGMIQRPDLFEQHTIHFHGYPNASSFYDGVPDASVAINIGGSFTYYYLAPDAGTYFWHCHITPPEHLQMGMVGQLYVRPRQDRVPVSASNKLITFLGYQNGIGLPAGVTPDLRTMCIPGADILCSATQPSVDTGATQGLDKLGNPQKYVYNDGDGSTAYDVEYPIQMHGFDPNFHFVGTTFNPEAFVDMKDKYFLLNGRGYPDTVGPNSGSNALPFAAPGPQLTESSDGMAHYSQPLPTLINIPVGGKAALRLVNLSVTEYHTLQTLGVPMKVVGWNAKLLRDQAGNNTEYYTNSITLGGGESADVILDASDTSTFKPGLVFYLYTPNLDHLANDAENFGGMMTEVHICNSVNTSTYGNTCN